MTVALIIFVILLCVAVFVGIAVVFNIPIFGKSTSSAGSLRSILSAQRSANDSRVPGGTGRQSSASLYESAKEAKVEKRANSTLTLRKKLKYGVWKMPPAMYRGLQLGIGFTAFLVAGQFLKLNILMQCFAFLIGPIIMNFLLTRSIERRFKAFDSDYPQFLLSLVGLLKTGMNAMGALEAAAQNLEPGALVRQECEMMVERLRFGVSEDRSIGSFGEDVFHPEIELFVQALLLSRRVGGTLSDTLDRLAKQVRKRQYFRSSANAAVGMQRGSIWFIIAILATLEVYLYFMYPEAIVGAINNPFGWQVYQGGITVMILGIYWVRQVTKIRV